MTAELICNSTNVRKANPTLYRSVVAHAIISILAAFNFWTTDPPFVPYNISENIVGVGFLLIGLLQLISIHFHTTLRRIRKAAALSGGVTLCWGLANTYQFFFGPATLQLPIFVSGLGIVQLLSLLGSPIDSRTETE